MIGSITGGISEYPQAPHQTQKIVTMVQKIPRPCVNRVSDVAVK